jgi:hypothetical protein
MCHLSPSETSTRDISLIAVEKKEKTRMFEAAKLHLPAPIGNTVQFQNEFLTRALKRRTALVSRSMSSELVNKFAWKLAENLFRITVFLISGIMDFELSKRAYWYVAVQYRTLKFIRELEAKIQLEGPKSKRNNNIKTDVEEVCCEGLEWFEPSYLQRAT